MLLPMFLLSWSRCCYAEISSGQDQEAQYDAVLTGLKAGYRHIDTARVFVQ
jgi:diketogulonate reductase-like aldo/keto reductase